MKKKANFVKRNIENRKAYWRLKVRLGRDGSNYGKKEVQQIRAIRYLDNLRISRELSRISEYSY